MTSSTLQGGALLPQSATSQSSGGGGAGASTVCPGCGSTDIDVDRCRGNAVCTGCGQVLDQNMIVNDVEFIETGSGDAKRAVGQFVGVNQRGMKSSFAGFHPGMQQDCMEHSIEKGRRMIYQFATTLSIHGHGADLAHGFYKMLLERKFVRGRRSALVAASCLYLACRNEQLPYLLLDFSDQLEESVTDLSQMYIRIARELCINPLSADPCIYIERFCERLDFGQETKDVAMTSMRILCRMKRDWIACGRRPFGLCGASIFLGAKLHGFDRALTDIVKVVGAQVSTMTKRLKEFTRTATSKLTIEEFYLVDLEEEHDPPSFHEARAKRGINHPEFNEEEFQRLDSEIERNIQMEKMKKAKKGSHPVALNSEDSSSSCSVDLSQVMGLPKDTLNSVEGSIDGVTEVIQEVLSKETEDDTNEGTGYLPVTCESLGIDPLNPAADCYSLVSNGLDDESVSGEVDENGDKRDAELFIDDLDDREIDSYILSPEEASRKAMLWAATYGEFMEQRAAKRKLKEEEKEKNAGNKRRRSAKPKNQEGYSRPTKKLKTDRPAATANEAIDNIIKQKNISEKINVAVLQNLRIEKPLSATQSNSPDKDSANISRAQDSFADKLSSGKIASRLASAFRKGPTRNPNNAASATSKSNSVNLSSSVKLQSARPNGTVSPKKPAIMKEIDIFAKN